MSDTVDSSITLVCQFKTNLINEIPYQSTGFPHPRGGAPRHAGEQLRLRRRRLPQDPQLRDGQDQGQDRDELVQGQVAHLPHHGQAGHRAQGQEGAALTVPGIFAFLNVY